MPRQQTQQRGPKDNSSKKKQQPRKRPNKALNALAIAEQQFPVKPKIRRNRLGEEYGQHTRKRHAAGSDEEESDGDGPDNKRRRFGGDGSDSDAGSDGQGRRWRIGHVDSDDDSELDSDEALGESDEERFEGFTFRGSGKPKSKAKPKPESKKKSRPISLSEDVEDEDEEDEDEDEDSDDLGEDAIDLTTAWDMNVAAEEEEAQAGSKSKKRDEDFGSEEDEEEEEGDDEDEEDSESNEDSDFDMSDDEDAVDEHGLAKLQSFVNSMGTGAVDRTKKKGGKHEHTAPTEFGLSSTQKLTIADLMPSITDSRLKNSLKHVDTAPANKTTSGIPGKLDAPLAKRQQDRLDRTAAYEKSKETMDRWLETVKHNRRAEHLMFPLVDPDAEQTHRIDVTKPQTDLEHAIQDILVESGLTDNKGKSAEEQVQEFEELQARKLPIEEIRARRAELRQRRDLLFREEVRAKRIKKIKSKSYRRVHRKEREKLEQQERQALLDAGVDPDEEDREKFERQRAEARMGLKHKESKFAKSLKQTGRTAWDEEARLGAADMALREEELRKRIEGKRATRGDEDYLGSSSSESEEENPWDEEADSDAEKRKLRQKLSKLEGGEDGELELKGPHSKLLSMKFMQNAEASRKAQNDAEVRKLNRELHGEESQSEAESEVGRRKFGHSDKNKAGQQQKPKALPRNEFEEPLGSDEEADAAEQDAEVVTDRKGNNAKPGRSANKPRGGLSKAPEPIEPLPRRRTLGCDNQQTVDINLDDAAPSGQSSRKASKKEKAPSTSTQKQRLEPQDDSEEESVPVLLKNHDLVKRAFAGDEVVQDFELEKRDTIRDEDDQVIDNTLPGWGSWAGEGVSKKQQKRQKRFLTKVDGVKPDDRKDAKLARVIINEKRVKKNNKYMATQLPHEFESKAQYERSLRLPIGPEWTTKETFQNATKPRVMVKQGVIKPMEKPTV
ncbi:Utp14-domain-containing protein [Aspergillus campestris IBT 28561]|uniref:Utp14-domain-containing protein n=1 Tax=Aspergillus campestris (strain IBT 28561) TaxID=1392248 RepID=A0A2I1D3A1_ASPC2|nr:Utp14-domain-containing protein [Aspergillus campestris IBT 28561]PKY04336.1 Utp14-domain-containing protein [Aspergillus campestris IBT 28561]